MTVLSISHRLLELERSKRGRDVTNLVSHALQPLCSPEHLTNGERAVVSRECEIKERLEQKGREEEMEESTAQYYKKDYPPVSIIGKPKKMRMRRAYFYAYGRTDKRRELLEGIWHDASKRSATTLKIRETDHIPERAYMISTLLDSEEV